MPKLRRPSSRILAIAVVLTAACVVQSARIQDVPKEVGQRVEAPTKVHLIDGSTVLFRTGLTVGAETITGSGLRYDLTQRNERPVSELPLDSILAMEAYEGGTNWPGTIVLTALGTAAAVAGGALLAVAIFGSCPTFYVDSAGVESLEAEAFSYSIASLFEARDVDRLRIAPDDDGVIRIIVRNEALETHYINHLEVLEVAHAADERVLPSADARILAVQSPRSARSAVDAAGRDIRGVIATADGDAFTTARSILISRTADALDDEIVLELPHLEGADSVVLTLRARNSLLATVLFYDVMLADQGARALDWQTHDLERLSSAVEIGTWARAHLGMRVSVERDGRLQSAGYIADPGPIAWKDVAIVIPAPDRGGRVHLSFAADSWRIDRIAVATTYRTAQPRAIPVARITASAGPQTEGLAGLAEPDAHYLVTTPGQEFTAEFDAGPTASQRTFLIASQGYYVEWIRRDWIERGRDSRPFRAAPESLLDAMQRWTGVQDSLEQRFYASRIPTR